MGGRIMKPGEGIIDWSTAEIAATKHPQLHTLTVEVTGELGIHWRSIFESSARIHNQGQERRPRQWGNMLLTGSGGTMSSTVIQVDEVKPGAETELKAQLDHFAKQASERAVPAEENEERLRAERQAKVQDRANQVIEMQ